MKAHNSRGRRDVNHTDTVVEWTRDRRLHLVALEGLLKPADLAAVRSVAAQLDDLDRVADAIALIMGGPVRVRPWEPPTADFFLEVETLG
jgi:hypothetical protein